MNTERTKIISRIEKLMAMANDKSSPNEAAIALNNMQKLMAKHGISTDTMELSKIKEETTDIISKNKRAIPEHLASLAVTIANAFECNALINTTYEGQSVTFCGTHPGPLLAKYATAVLARELTKARKDYMSRVPKHLPVRIKTDAGNSFAAGWVAAVADKAGALSPKASAEKQQLIDRYVDQQINPVGEAKTTSTKNRYADSMQAGAEAAKDVQLNHGMDSGAEQLKLGAMT